MINNSIGISKTNNRISSQNTEEEKISQHMST